VDNSLSLLNCKALLLSVYKLYNVALVAFEKLLIKQEFRNYNIQKEPCSFLYVIL
jgi:hypothetical protein